MKKHGRNGYEWDKKRNMNGILTGLFLLVLFAAILSLGNGASHLTARETVNALFGRGEDAAVRIVRNIRLPRILAAVLAGASLSVSGLMMQTNLGNPMASPQTLGVTNAAVFGANLSILVFGGGLVSVGGNLANYDTAANPFGTSLFAFVFALASILVILGLSGRNHYSPGIVILAGVAIGSVWTAMTTILQFYATDVGISAAVVWSFGDLGRATYKTDLLMLGCFVLSYAFLRKMSWAQNAMLTGDEAAVSMGVDMRKNRFVSLFLASVLTAVTVSFLGTIGFVGIICPHVAKRVIGQDHRQALPASALTGSLLLVLADTLSRTIGQGAALPVGAITSLLGAPFFLWLIFTRGAGHSHHGNED